MEIELFNKEKHLEQVEDWSKERNVKIYPDWFPKVGVIVPGVAVAFLLQTDTPVAYLECLITNPASEASERKEAILRVFNALLKIAHELEFEQVQGVSNIENVHNYLKEVGLIEVNNNMKMFAGRLQ